MGSDRRPLLHCDQCVTLEISKGVNTHETSNTVMKQTAVFHYTKRKNRGGSWENTRTGLKPVVFQNNI